MIIVYLYEGYVRLCSYTTITYDRRSPMSFYYGYIIHYFSLIIEYC